MSRQPLSKILLVLLCFCLLATIWEYCSRALPHLSFILPPPTEIFRTLWELRARFYFHTLCTLKEMLGGFLLALLAAFPLAWTMIRYQSSRSILQPLFIVTQCLPMFTLAPIMVIWFGWSYTAIAIPTALMIFFPLTLNIYQGLRSTPQDLLEFFQVNQASAWQIFFKLRLPSAVPHIFAGFRISAGVAGVGAVAGEWAGAQNGLGMLMLESRRNTDLEITFGALFCLTLVSTLLYGLILYCETLALPPRPSLSKLKLRISRYLTDRKQRRKSGFAIPFFIVAFLLLGLSGCQQKKENRTRLLLDWLPNPNHIPLYVGIEKAFFQDVGIHLNILKMHDNGGGISYLTSRQADLLVNHMPGTIKACSNGAPLKIVGLLVKEPLSGFIYRSDLSIETTQDLSGSTLGYCLGGPDTSFLNFLLEKGKIEPKERKNISVDLISAMGTENVDFIFGGFWNIEPAQLRSLGMETSYFPIQEFGVPNYYEMIILAHGDSKESSAPFASSFQVALQKSIDYCCAHPEEAFQIYRRYNPDRREKTFAWEENAWKVTYPTLAKSQKTDLQELHTFYQWLQSQEIVNKPFNINTLTSYE